MNRYFQEDCPVLAGCLTDHTAWVRDELEASGLAAKGVHALVLGGGYGRGEGGVLIDAEGEASLFNDLDYFLFTDNPGDRRLRKWIDRIELEGTRELGIDVEIKALPKSDIGDPSTSMMFFDLIAGHHVVWGDGAFLENLVDDLNPARIAPVEASRLLWNRGSGLYFALCRIRARQEMDFVQRNHQKCILALCDALLCSRGEYAASVTERLERVRAGKAGELGDELLPLYEKAVEFKLRPEIVECRWRDMAAENSVVCESWEKVFLEVEGRRMGKEFQSLKDYAARGKGLFRGEVPMWKGPLFALRDGLRYRSCLKPVWDYPRAALMRALCCLLDQKNHPTALAHVGDFLPGCNEATAQSSLPPIVQWESCYADWWRRYS